MIPLKDNIRSQSVPYVNYAVIGLCTAVFLLQVGEGDDVRPGASLVDRFGMIPVRVFDPEARVFAEALVRDAFGGPRIERVELAPPPFSPWLTLVTCIFLHGGLLHFLGNMWFLFIFGDNVEDRLGHVVYALFYVGAGIAASAAHLFTNGDSSVPTIGASGAIAGVMGAYFLIYPHARVVTLVPLFIFVEVMVLPAAFFLGLWFLLQFFQGAMAITDTQSGGVAWWAHIGGFAAGYVFALILRATHHLHGRDGQVLEGSTGSYRYGRRDLWPPHRGGR